MYRTKIVRPPPGTPQSGPSHWTGRVKCPDGFAQEAIDSLQAYLADIPGLCTPATAGYVSNWARDIGFQAIQLVEE